MDGQFSDPTYDTISVMPCSPHIGAEISDIDLTRPLSNSKATELRQAFTQYLVLFFRDQQISFEDHVRLGEYFGPIGAHVGKKTISQTTDDPRVRKFHADENTPRVSGDLWHTDQSCALVPPMASILYIHTIPPQGGGDTIFASMYRAYETLSDRMKIYLAGLTALHDGRDILPKGPPAPPTPWSSAIPRAAGS